MDAVLLNGLQKSFGEVRAVNNLSVTVPPASVYGFLGPNGAGKTTTLRMIMDIIRPDSGQIRIFGDSSLEQAKARIGYMPEERGLYRKMTVTKVLAFFGAIKGLAGNELSGRVSHWLRRVELMDWATKKVEELLRGMHEKLQFAVTAINAPELLILDEPFAGLDPLNTDLLKAIMLEIQKDSDTLEELARNKLLQGQVDVYVVLDSDVLDGSGKIYLYTYKQKASNIDILSTIEYICYNEVVNQRYKMQDLSKELLEKLRRVPIERVEISSAEGQDRVQSKTDRVLKMIFPFFFMYLMFLGIFISGQQIISSVIEEKSSRVIEVLLSAVSPFQLMAGNILGLAGTGLTLVSLWAAAAFLTAHSQGLNIEITAQFVIYFAIYYILGFLLVSSILAGAGSVCNTIKET